MIYPVLEESTFEGGKWTHNCGMVLLAAPVYHPIHDGPFALSGSGEVWVETVPYCPQCGSKPSSIGEPLRQNPKDVDDAAILRRMRDRPR